MRIRFDTKSAHLPRNGKFLEYPVISLNLGTQEPSTIDRDVLIDTGASHTTFPLSLTKHLGINLESLPTTAFKSASGHEVVGHIAMLTLSIRSPENSRSGWNWQSEVILADIKSPLFGVLGHESFFEYFKFELDAEDESFYLEENSKFPGRVLEYS